MALPLIRVFILQLLIPMAALAGTATDDPFDGKTLVAKEPKVYAESATQFRPWSGASVPVPPGGWPQWARIRIGTFNFGPGRQVHLECAEAPIAPPSQYEFVDAKSGQILGKFETLFCSDAVWYFTGTGQAYLNQAHLLLCDPRYTRKLVLRRNEIVEVVQPLDYVGADSIVEAQTPLFDAQDGGTQIASLSAGMTVHVIGVATTPAEGWKRSLLIRTPFGLTGWHRRGVVDAGVLGVYQCR